MDKDTIIQEILDELILRSPDGLASGHDSLENIAILNEILAERNNFDLNPFDLKYWEIVGDKNPKLVPKKDHPTLSGLNVTYQQLAKRINKIKQYYPNITAEDPDKIEQMLFNTKYGKVAGEKKWTVDFLVTGKFFNENSALKIFEAINNLTKNKQEFLLNKFDSLTPQEAVSYVNEKSKESDFSSFMAALDNARSKVKKKSDEEDGSGGAAGRGEYIMVLLIKDAKSGGARSGDIILGDGKKVDVKESHNYFRVSAAAFGPRRFEKIPYVHAIIDLAIHCQDPKIAKVMEDLIEQANLQEEVETGRRGKKIREKSGAIEFVKNPSFRTLTASKILGLEALRQYVIGIKRGEEGKAIAADKVEFDVKNTTELLKVQKIEQPDLDKIKNPDPAGSEVKVTVAPIETEKQELEVVLPKIKKFEFFKLDALYDPITVANEMFDVMSTGDGNYTGGIITHFNNKFEYEPNLLNWHDKWKFVAYAQGGPAFSKRGTSASKDTQ